MDKITVQQLREWLRDFDSEQYVNCEQIGDGAVALIIPGNMGGYFELGVPEVQP